jgi:hypothetical protein
MAVTLIKRPYNYVPAYNPMWFEASSTQTAQPNFNFFVIIQAFGGPAVEYRVAPDPVNSHCYWDAQSYVEKYVENYYPFGLSGWQTCTDGLTQFAFDIGEEYGTTPAQYSGASGSFYAWNASLTTEERAEYHPNLYCSNLGIIPLNSLPSAINATSTQDLVIYFLNTDSLLDKVSISTFDGNGSTIGTYDIANVTGSTYICFNGGAASLATLTASVNNVATSGTFPIITSSVASYELFFNGSNGTVGAKNYSYVVTLDEGCGRFYNKSLFYLNRFGAFDFVNLYGDHKKEARINKQFYKTLGPVLEESHTNSAQSVDYVTASPRSISKKVLSSTYETFHSFASFWLTDLQRITLVDLFTSPSVFLNSAYSEYKRLSGTDTVYKFSEPTIEKLVNLRVNVSEGITERRQIE